MTTTLVISLVVISVFFLLALYGIIRLFLTMMDVEDRIQRAVDVLDECHVEMSKILELPVFFDSVEVRQVIAQIKRSRDAVLYVANVIGFPEADEDHFDNAEEQPTLDSKKNDGVRVAKDNLKS